MPAHCFISLEWFRNRTKLPIGIFTGRVGAEAFTVYIYSLHDFLHQDGNPALCAGGGWAYCDRCFPGLSWTIQHIYIYINTYKDNVNQETDYIYIYINQMFLNLNKQRVLNEPIICPTLQFGRN